MVESQKHLSHKSQIDLGSFYTPSHLVKIAFEIIDRNIDDLSALSLIDTSCGYGSFLHDKHFGRVVGVDIDNKAIDEAKKNVQNVEFFVENSLNNISRKNYQIADSEKLVIVGNPPYNDTTSIIRQDIKDKSAANEVDSDVKTRDFGMSFLLSYNKLKADYVCVLHPLSYLVKKSNFVLLKDFIGNYQLIDGLIVSSHEFSDTSRSMAFPILIAFYKRDKIGMDYEYIKNYEFRVKDDGTFRLSDFDTIANYVQKYPNRKYLNERDKPVAKFWTLRDINALRRNRTFIEDDTYNTVYVLAEKLPYYCYIDIFKQYVDKMPYFIGNCDVIIDNDEFLKVRECFIYQSLKTNPILRKSRLKFRKVPDAKHKIDNYFETLLTNKLGEKYAANC
ncbi:MAG: N-6 DNA methylase [Helicobacteraceae bacterium]|jgi:predicted RNA methylase|nr:N-6 DNA methylase [Helicobacteraceae bacterium]